MFKNSIPLLFFCLFGLQTTTLLAAIVTFHVAIDGEDVPGAGSAFKPWATISYALKHVPDNSAIEVHPGTYDGQVRIGGFFPQGLIIRSQVPYRAKLRHDGTVLSVDSSVVVTRGITLEGFDVAHSGEGAGALVDIAGKGPIAVSDISLNNNILHDSYSGDIVRLGNGCTRIAVTGNIFYNQGDADEHLELNSVSAITVQDNIFFNDFAGSGRVNQNSTSHYIAIKDSNGIEDGLLGSRDITVRRNIFLNWQGSPASTFLQIGGDGQLFYEAVNVLVENNLMLGNSSNTMYSAFGVMGGRDISFRNNTISGDLPARAYAMHLDRTGFNPANSNIQFYNNAWSDHSATMGDFSHTPFAATAFFTLLNNLYWNGGAPIPQDIRQRINYTDDPSRLIANPLLPPPVSIPLPGWLAEDGQFADGSTTIRAAFINLASFARPALGSPLIDNADDRFAADDDILGKLRKLPGTIGAYEGDEMPGLAPSLFLLLLEEQ